MELIAEGISKKFDNFVAVNNISFSINKGELFTLLGPSGCGKSTTLRMIAGFFYPERGKIILGEKDITSLNANRRGMAMVFQNYALFPHMNVFENISFGLKMQKLDKTTINKKVSDVLNLIQLPNIAQKYPRELSGGMQQRVAIARAIVIHPKILLLDEPLSNLDAKLREELRIELREIQQKIGITTIFVTHDISEAFTMSDRIAVMKSGKIMQIGTPRQIYEQPANEFVGTFVGKSNIFTVKIDNRMNGIVLVADKQLQIKFGKGKAKFCCGETLKYMIRPERISILERSSNNELKNSYQAKVTQAYYLGDQCHYEVSVHGEKIILIAKNNGEKNFEPNEDCYIEWNINDGICFKNHGEVENNENISQVN